MALAFILTSPALASDPSESPTLIVIQGAPGTDQYGEAFTEWRTRLVEAGARGGATTHVIAPATGETSNKEQLQTLLAAQSKDSPAELWLVFLGHGTFDGKQAKFNLDGPDVSADELGEWLKPFERPVVIVNCASASAQFLKLAGESRVVITATRSGYELNYARFGDHFSRAVADAEADLDKDGQTSLLETYLLASRRTAEFYEADARLATEHALLDDTGDGLGSPADFFRGVRAVKKAKDNAIVDGLRAHQIHLVPSERERHMPADLKARRNALELSIAKLRDRKKEMSEDAYYAELEKLAVELAELYGRIDDSTQ